jgi:hypothetical protein
MPVSRKRATAAPAARCFLPQKRSAKGKMANFSPIYNRPGKNVKRRIRRARGYPKTEGMSPRNP